MKKVLTRSKESDIILKLSLRGQRPLRNFFEKTLEKVLTKKGISGIIKKLTI